MNIQDFKKQIEELIDFAIAEDIIVPKRSSTDITTAHSALACFPNKNSASAKLLVKADGILAGVEVARVVAHKVRPEELRLDSIYAGWSSDEEG
jgi:nicotinate-nucleotide pyrophosphorylase